MKRYKKGDRIGAVLKSDDDTVYLLGYGVYDGDDVPPNDPSGERGLMSLVHEVGNKNPKIKLDDGRIVWGCECWWGSEKAVKESIGTRTVITLTNYPENEKTVKP